MLFGLIDQPTKLMPKCKIGKVEFEPQIRLAQLLMLQVVCFNSGRTYEYFEKRLGLSNAAVARFGEIMRERKLVTITRKENESDYRINATVEGHALVLAVSHQLAEYLVWATEKIPNVSDDTDFDDMHPHLSSLL